MRRSSPSARGISAMILPPSQFQQGEVLQNLFSIEGKTALVTGGSRGIGEMIAAGFLASGATVYISSRKAEVLEATARRLAQEYGGECTALPADLSNVAGIEGLAGALAEHEERLDILVNNAGATWARHSTSFRKPAGTR